MKQSYLIQRLLKPYPVKEGSILRDNPFAFGGGFVNGGLTNEAVDLLRPIFRFDYMGAAEFEFGEVPKALSKIVENKDKYSAFEFLVKYKYHDWVSRETKVYEGKKSIYVICQKDWIDEVKERISYHAKDKHTKVIHYTKEATMLARALALPLTDDRVKDYQGWLELDNGFFFFTNQEMFEKVCVLFEIKKEG